MSPYDRDDESLRSAFAELRVADERSAPSFEDVRARRAPSGRSVFAAASVGRRLAVAAGLVLLAGLAYRMIGARTARLTVPREVIALSAWRPGTDVLLDTPARSLLRHAPQLGASLIDVKLTGEFR
jgi:hypothetical protein